MIIFSHIQTISRYSGYAFTYSDSRRYRWYSYTCHAICYTLFLPLCGYIYQNIGDVDAMTELLSLCTAGPNAICKGFVFLLRRQSIRRLLTILQRNVDLKEERGRIEPYRNVERTVRWWSLFYIAIITISINVVYLGPIVTVVYHCWLGDYRSDMWTLPVKLYFPFDARAAPQFQMIYAIIIVCANLFGYIMVAVDGTFMGCAAQLTACQRDVYAMLVGLNGVFETGGRRGAARKQRQVKRELLRCVRFYDDILRWSNQLAVIYSPIIFVQLFISIVQMCALAFQIQSGTNVDIDKWIANAVTVVIVLSELLMYCYFGQEYTYYGERVADAAYAAPWYRCPPAIRPYYCMLMRQAQRPRFFVGFKLVRCSLDNFKSILHTVGSMLALLRSVAE